jgi:hypothetical protein
MCRWLFSLLAGVVLWGGAVPAVSAQRRSVEDCNVIKQVAGGFTFEHRPDLNLRALSARPGPFRFVHDGSVVGFSCLRETIVPQGLDLEVLQAGFSLSIGDTGNQLRVIDLMMKNGQVSWKVTAGQLRSNERREIDRAVARMRGTSTPAVK